MRMGAKERAELREGIMSGAVEGVARIIDPQAWGWHDRWLTEAGTERMVGRVASLRKSAEQIVSPSLAKAAAIRLLSQGGKP